MGTYKFDKVGNCGTFQKDSGKIDSLINQLLDLHVTADGTTIVFRIGSDSPHLIVIPGNTVNINQAAATGTTAITVFQQLLTDVFTSNFITP